MVTSTRPAPAGQRVRSSRVRPSRSFASWVLLCSLAFSSSVSAQPLEPALAAAARVKAGLLRLAVASGGSYGDEGEQIASSIEMVAQALADINWAVRQVEARAETLDCASQLDLARALHAVGRADDALARLEIASRDHTCIDALMLQGHLHQRSGRREQALEAFLAAWRRDRTDPLAAYWFIHNEPAVTDTDEGRRAMDVLRETYRAARAGSQTRALRRFVTLGGSAASESGPVVLPAAYMRGYSLLLAGARDAALNELRKAAAADPLVVDAARSMPDVIAGIAALRGGHVSLARDRFAHAVTLAAGSSEAHRLLATAHWLERDLEGAATALQQALRLRPDDERSRLMLARVLDARGAYEDAAAVLRETLERRADSPLAQLWLAVVSQKLNREGDMAQLYVAIAEGWPIEGASRLLATAGYLYQNAVQPDAALDAFRRGVHADPNARDLHIALGRVHAEYERRDAAFAEYVAALMLAPDDPNAYLGIAQLHMIDGRYDEAVPALERVVAQYPDYAEARHVLGNALMRLGRTQEATRELREFQRLQVAATERRRRSMAVGILREEAILRASHGAVERAVSLWQQVIALEPSVASHHAELGGVLLDAGQPLTALPHLERAAALGGIPDVYRRLAAAYMQLGRRDDATAARAKYESALMEPAPPGSDR